MYCKLGRKFRVEFGTEELWKGLRVIDPINDKDESRIMYDLK